MRHLQRQRNDLRVGEEAREKRSDLGHGGRTAHVEHDNARLAAVDANREFRVPTGDDN